MARADRYSPISLNLSPRLSFNVSITLLVCSITYSATLSLAATRWAGSSVLPLPNIQTPPSSAVDTGKTRISSAWRLHSWHCFNHGTTLTHCLVGGFLANVRNKIAGIATFSDLYNSLSGRRIQGLPQQNLNIICNPLEPRLHWVPCH